MNKPEQLLITAASLKDIPILVSHNRLMFEEIWTIRKMGLDWQKLGEMDDAYGRKLKTDLLNGTCKAWIVRENGTALASGAISIASLIPVPADSCNRVAYLHSVYTESRSRSRGLAEMIVKKAMECCRSEGINRIFLHTSEAGRPIYEKIGFNRSNNVMGLFLGDHDR